MTKYLGVLYLELEMKNVVNGVDSGSSEHLSLIILKSKPATFRCITEFLFVVKCMELVQAEI